MSDFAELMETNPPRFVVQFQRGPDGSENFQWGVVGQIPLLSLIGYITSVQMDLTSDEWIPECESDPPALVVVWDNDSRNFSCFKHSDIPTDPLVGMLETIKAMLVDSRLAQQTAAKGIVMLGPDGQPMRS